MSSYGFLSKQSMVVSSNNKSVSGKYLNIDFTLTGSRICLEPRFSLSGYSNSTSLPIKNINYSTVAYRSSSALPTIGEYHHRRNKVLDEESFNRPQSADNILFYSMRNLKRSLSNKVYSDSSSSRDNIFQNMLNEHAEKNIVPMSGNVASRSFDGADDLKPGLVAKPPLPSSTVTAGTAESGQLSNNKSITTTPDKETFDEIVALKFQQWFPNSVVVNSSPNSRKPCNNNDEYSSLDDDEAASDSASLEVLSFKEHRFQTCEYRYEVPSRKKNRFRKTSITSNGNGYKKAFTANSAVRTLRANEGICSLNDLTGNSDKYVRRCRTSSAANRNKSDSRDASGHKPILKNSPGPIYATKSSSNFRRKTELVNNRDSGPFKKYSSIDDCCDNSKLNANQFSTSAQSDHFRKSSSAATHRKITFQLDTNNGTEDEDYKLNNPRNKQDIDDFASSRNALTYDRCDDESNSCCATANNAGDKHYYTDIRDDCCLLNDKENLRTSKNSDNFKRAEEVDEKIMPRNGGESINGYCPKLTDWNNARNGVQRISPSLNSFKSQNDDHVSSWMETHDKKLMEDNESKSKNNSVYNEIVDILKVLETENDENFNSNIVKRDNQDKLENRPSTSVRAIWSLLDEAESVNSTISESDRNFDKKEVNSVPKNNSCEEPCENDRGRYNRSINWNRLSELINLPSTELAQKIIALQILLQEKEGMVENLHSRCKTTELLLQQQTQEAESSYKKMNDIILKLKEEKRNTNEEYNRSIKEMERKHEKSVENLEERHKVEIKKAVEKQAAQDKIHREKWMESKTLKIKELTMKSLEPELNKMSVAHQEEIADLRRFHQRQLHEMEESWNRKMAVLKERLEADKEKAVAIEREMAREKLENEISELEKRYQDQRKRLLAEIHIERENIEREGEAILAVKEKEAAKKWEKKTFEIEKKLEDMHNKHQEEMEVLRNNLALEKQTWIKNQMMELADKENKIREECKKQRDSHIEIAIQKLENEVTEKEKAAELKMKRLKDQYELEIKDLENTADSLRKKSNENRVQIQTLEDTVAQLRTRLYQAETELTMFKEKYDRLNKEQCEIQNIAKSETATKVSVLQSELNQSQLLYQSQIKALKGEHERELSQVYNRVKEMVMKKDDIINNLKKQKDAAVQQCCQLEKLLDHWRKDS